MLLHCPRRSVATIAAVVAVIAFASGQCVTDVQARLTDVQPTARLDADQAARVAAAVAAMGPRKSLPGISVISSSRWSEQVHCIVSMLITGKVVQRLLWNV